MIVPLAGRVVAAVIGGLLVLTAAYSVTGTLIVSRSVSSRLTRSVDKVGRKTEMTLVIARLQFEICAFAGATADQLDKPARPADPRDREWRRW